MDWFGLNERSLMARIKVTRIKVITLKAVWFEKVFIEGLVDFERGDGTFQVKSMTGRA